MSDFFDRMKTLAKADKKTIVLPEGEDPRTIEAAKQIVAEDMAHLIILGDPNKIKIDGVKVIDPLTDEKSEAYAEAFAELRKKKGITLEQAREQMKDYTYFGMMMVKMGDADGLVSGACHSTANTLRPALQILKTAPDAKLCSGFFFVVSPNTHLGANGTFVFADSGLNIAPNAEELSEIALSSVKTWQEFMYAEPRVAFLSYSTKGSAAGESAERSKTAAELFKEKAKDVISDGELQLDAAIIPEVADFKAAGSPVAGRANILIFPDLAAGNIGYKLAQRFGNAEAYGPLLQGIAKPVNDLSRGCNAKDIVGVVAITCIQAQHMA